MKKILLLAFFCNSAFAQIQVSQFNASWNSANGVAWVQDLNDCKTIAYVDINDNPKLATAVSYTHLTLPTKA